MANESTTSTLDDLISPMVAEALFVASVPYTLLTLPTSKPV